MSLATYIDPKGKEYGMSFNHKLYSFKKGKAVKVPDEMDATLDAMRNPYTKVKMFVIGDPPKIEEHPEPDIPTGESQLRLFN